MTLETISREEFDKRLEQSTENLRQQRLVLEAKAAALEDLIGRYASVLERLEAETEPDTMLSQQRNNLRTILVELAERTSAVAASL